MAIKRGRWTLHALLLGLVCTGCGRTEHGATVDRPAPGAHFPQATAKGGNAAHPGDKR